MQCVEGVEDHDATAIAPISEQLVYVYSARLSRLRGVIADEVGPPTHNTMSFTYQSHIGGDIAMSASGK